MYVTPIYVIRYNRPYMVNLTSMCLVREILGVNVNTRVVFENNQPSPCSDFSLEEKNEAVLSCTSSTTKKPRTVHVFGFYRRRYRITFALPASSPPVNPSRKEQPRSLKTPCVLLSFFLSPGHSFWRVHRPRNTFGHAPGKHHHRWVG